jgi:flagellar secretion chaperone FliS
MNAYSNASNQYLTQRVLGANSEHMVMLLLEGAQRFVVQAGQAMTRKDFGAKAKAINRASAILQELTRWLDREHGGELAQNLLRLYLWWQREIMDAGFKLDPSRLEKVALQMAEIRQSWEQAFKQRAGTPGASGFHASELVG